LRERNIFACGTVNPTREGLPKLKEEKNINRGDFDFNVCNDGVCMFRWKDKKGVNLIFSVHKLSDISSVDRMEKDGNRHKIPCPQVLKDYNRHMNFVDNFDRLKGDYQMDRKSKKWW
jgi:hypothetical protein